MEDGDKRVKDAKTESRNVETKDFVRLLSQHFGDGLVYLADEADRLLLKTAIDDGLISPDGHVTAAGYRLWRQATFD
ncbi:MAG: hypothetical protein R3174_03405 [Gammaproteobacteria bacterium]|nr:hypothetical protein [Gammaproteobacteria bacterium]